MINYLELTGKNIETVKIATSGAGAAAIACLNMLMAVGAKRENIWVADREGVVTKKRHNTVDRWRAAFAQDTEETELAAFLPGADIYVGLSAAGVLKPEMIKDMAPESADPRRSPIRSPRSCPSWRWRRGRTRMICTGRSDYPNQVNNVLCFPFIFRGALDVGATTINEEMKLAAAHAIAKLAHEPALEASATGRRHDVRAATTSSPTRSTSG